MGKGKGKDGINKIYKIGGRQETNWMGLIRLR
jgi:hypothetical protein